MKETKRLIMKVRVSPQLNARIKAAAQARGLTKSSWVRMIISDELAKGLGPLLVSHADACLPGDCICGREEG